MRKQAERFGAGICGNGRRRGPLQSPFAVNTEKNTYSANPHHRHGASPGSGPGIGEEADGRGVSTCAPATARSSGSRDRRVGGATRAGGGNLLTRFASKVLLVHRRDQFRASKSWSIGPGHPEDRVRLDTVIVDILDPARNESPRSPEEHQDGTETVGRSTASSSPSPRSNTKIFEAMTLDNGYIVLGMARKRASTDLRRRRRARQVYRQAVTAAGAGCRAAIEAERFLERRPVMRRCGSISFAFGSGGTCPSMPDAARYLSGKGRLSFREMALRFRDAGDIPRGFSPAVRRAVQTAEILSEAIRYDGEVVVDPRLSPGSISRNSTSARDSLRRISPSSDTSRTWRHSAFLLSLPRGTRCARAPSRPSI